MLKLSRYGNQESYYFIIQQEHEKKKVKYLFVIHI